MTKSTSNPLKCKGVKAFFRSNIFVLLAFAAPAIIMLMCFVLHKITPFGTKMVMVSDAWHQYYPFLREYQMLLKDGVLPLYSWNTGGGSDFLGVVGNYIASPLYLFVKFLPEGHFWLKSYLAFTVALRIGCAGGFMSIFLKRVFKKNDISIFTFSLMYAFCGFILGYYWNFMWLDSVALLPLVVAGTYGLLKHGNFSLYVVSLAFSVICSFYIGYFICVFVLLFSICYTIVEFRSFKHSMKNLGKMALYTAIAFLLTAFITVPTYMALSHSDSSADAAGFPFKYSINYAYGYDGENTLLNTVKAFARTVTNLLSFTAPITMREGEPNIFCGALALLLCVFYFTTGKVKLKEKLVAGSLCLFMLSSFVVNQLNYIWHGFNTPAMVYYRFSFIFSFILIVLAYRAYLLSEVFSKKMLIVSGAIITAYLALAFVFQKKTSVAVTAAAVVVLMVGFILFKAGKLKYRALSVLLCLFVLCESGCSAYYGTRVVSSSKGDDYPRQNVSVQALAEIGESKSEGELYRTEFIDSYCLNDGALYSIQGISTFNSMCRRDYSDFFAEFGLASSVSNNRFEYVEATPVENLFLSIKYLVGRAVKSTDDEAVMIPTEIVDSTYMEKIAEDKGNLLYENKAFVPSGFMADKALLDYELSSGVVLPQNAQNEIFSLATGIEKDVLVMVDESRISGVDLSTLTPREDIDDYYTYTREATTDEALLVEYEAPVKGSYYGLFRHSAKEEIDINCGDRVVKDPGEYAHIVSLGTLEKGDKISASLPLTDTESGRLGYYLFYLDNEVFEEGLDKLRESTMTLKEKTPRSIKGTINVGKDGLFTTSVLYDEGFKAFVDGKEVEITPVAKTFCAFELSEGEHEIEFKFTPEGMFEGIMVSAIGLIAFVAVALIVRKRRNR